MTRVRSMLAVLILLATLGVARSATAQPATPSPPAAPPATSASPSGVTARALPAAALVSWKAPAAQAGVRVTGYTVTASPGGATATTTGATNVVVKGLANGTKYRFTVQARGTNGMGPASAPSPAVTPSATGVVYAHDADGRVTAVFDGTGAGSRISYDAVGNITGIANLPATSLAVAQVWPPRAKDGATVDVFGTGFGTAAAAVSVDFHGASAKPSAVTANHFQVTVPASASSGTLTVTVGSGSATWPSFTVLAPVAPMVSGVDKRVVDGGGTVTVSGTGFDTDKSRDVVSINGTKATVTAATATSLTLAAPPFPVAGPISVRTPNGTASGPDVVVPPTPYLAADVSWAGRITPNATTTVSVTGQQQVAVALFEVAPGQQGSVEVAHETFDNNYELHVYDPIGKVVAHRESVSGDVFFNLSYLSTPGTYTVEIDPAGTDTGSVQVTPGMFTDPTATATVDGGPASLTTTTAGQKAVFSIAGQADERIMVAVSQDSSSEVETVSLINPAGSVLSTTSGTGSGIGPVLLPVTGTYTLVVAQYFTDVGTVTAHVTSVPPDIQQSLTVDGPAANLTIAAPGQKAYLTFAGTAGQLITAEMTPDWGWNGCDDLTLNDPSGNLIHDSSCYGSVDRIALPATGTYTLVFDPDGIRTGAFTARVFTVPADVQATAAVNGQPSSVTLGTHDQHGVISFAATAGQKVFIACSLSGGLDQYATEFTFASASGVTRTTECDTEIELFDTSILDATGTDTITVVPGQRQTGTATVTIYPVPADARVTAPVNGSPTALTIGTPGQRGLFSFAATAGNKLRVGCSVSSTLNQNSVMFVFTSASGATQTSYCDSQPLFDTFTLDATGTDTIAVIPVYGETGTASITLNPVTATLTPAGVPARPGPASAIVGSAPQHGGSISAGPPKPPAAPKAAPKWTYRGDAHGTASLTGQVRDTGGKPLADVILRVDSLATVTDSHGRFTLDGLPQGTRVLVIDGRGHRDHGVYSYQVHLKPGRNRLNYTPYLPLIDTASEVSIQEPTRAPVVLRTPKVPGLEVHIPAGARITDADGKPVYRLGITPIPIDRTPIPMPPGVQIPIFFTVQPAGGVVTGGDVRVVYPNYLHDKPGTPASFWHYEKAGEGWESYGRGAVDAKGAQVVPAPGTVLHDFDGAMFNSTDGRRASDKGGFWDKVLHGDPVDTSTGLLQLHQTDLALPDTVPITLDRAYNSGDTDPVGNQRPEGVGTDDTYDMFLSSTNQWQVADLNLTDGSQVHYVRVSPGTGYTDAVMESQVSSGPYYKSRMYWNGLGWDLNLTDGTTLVFGEMAPLQEIRDPHGNTLVILRAEKNTFGSYVGPVTSVRSPNGFWLAYTSDPNGRTTRVGDNAGRTVSYGYDTTGHLHTVTDVDNHATTYNYDPTSGLLATVIDARGQTALTNSYDINGRVHQQTLADGGHFTFDYTLDGNGNVTATRTTDPAGHVTRDIFDSRGMVTSTTEAVGTARQRVTTYTHDPTTGLVSAVTDPLGFTTRYSYDEFGNITRTARKDGTSAAYTTTATFHGPFGRPDTVTDALGHTTTLTWTPAGDLATAEDPLHHTTVNAYNADGTLKTSTDPLHHVTSYAYTGGLLSGVTDPDGRTTTTFRDAAGRATLVAAPSGLVSSVTYDAANLPLTATDEAGATARFGYDNNGNLTSVTDALNHVTRYAPDVMNRLHVRTDPLGHTDTYTYDPDGQVQNYTDRRGRLTAYGYDEFERRGTAAYGKTSSGAESTVTYGYDAGDRVTSVADSAAGTIAVSYDDLASTTVTTDTAGTVTDRYNNAGRLVTASASGLPATAYGYDDAGELKTVTRASQQVTYSYDAAGRQTSRALPGGVTITPGYTDAGLLTGLAYANANGTLGALNYAYDTDNQRIADSGSWARTTLPAAESGQAYDADDRLTGVSGRTLSYDDAGNLLSDGTTSYTWNGRGQLTGVTQAGASTTLSYDAGNRLAGTTTATGTTSYRYAGQDLLTRTSGGSTTSYLNGPGPDDTLTATTGSTTQDLLPDLLGSTVAVTDGAGTPITSYTYGVFGAVSSDNPTDTNPLRYTGRPSGPDLPAGLQDNRSRDYSPGLHRFLSADPVGHDSGQTDPYTYAAGDPADNTDPSGNWAQYAAGCVVGAGYEALKGWLTGTKHSWGDYLGGALNGCVQGALLASGFGAEEELGLGAAKALETAPEDAAALGDLCANSFTADTRVEMADGSSKPISKVRIGDRVLATDPLTGTTTARTVTALIHHRGPHTMVRISLTGGGSLRTTDHHPFWDATTGRWTDAVDLRSGDQLREPSGALVTVAGTRTYTADLTAYNLTVDTTHSYYVLAGRLPVLVHNAGCLPTPGEAQELVEAAEPAGSALKEDAWHRSASYAVDDIGENGTVFNLTGGDGVDRVLIQAPGEVNGIAGRFEWILDGNQLTHQMFVRGGTINGIPIKP